MRKALSAGMRVFGVQFRPFFRVHSDRLKTDTRKPSIARVPKVGFVSLGCPKALVDSERILTRLRAEGYEVAPSYGAADLVVVNTCGFIDAAVDESLDAIGEALARERQGHRHRLPRRAAAEDSRPPSAGAEDHRPAALRRSGRVGARASAAEARAVPRPDSRAGRQADAAPLRLSRRFPKAAIITAASASFPRCAAVSSAARSARCCARPSSWCAPASRSSSSSPRTRAPTASDLKYAAQTLARAPSGAPASTISRAALGELGVWIRLHYVYPYPHVDQVIELMADGPGAALPRHSLPACERAHPEAHEAPGRRGEHARSASRHGARVVPGHHACAAPSSSDSRARPSEDFEELLDWLRDAQLDRVGCFEYSPVEGAAANALPEAPVPGRGQAGAPRAVHGTRRRDQRAAARRRRSAARCRCSVDRLEDGAAIARSSARCAGNRRRRAHSRRAAN